MEVKKTYQGKPFVKWVGGKTQLLDEICKRLPDDFGQMGDAVYIEPFVGGGAVLFHLLQRFPNIEKAVINDIVPELICTYRVIKDNVDSLISELTKLQHDYISKITEERTAFYLSMRDKFNSGMISDIETAALFIFLNRTCFNGLYRVNSKGKFNVPHGRYTNPRILDESTLRADAELLKKVDIICGDFTLTAEYASSHTLFYIDPPYRPLNRTSAFTSYSSGGFDDNEQIRLHDFCKHITRKGACIIASNSDPKNIDISDNFFDSLYEDFQIERVSASRMINSKGTGRGAVSEIMISNTKNHHLQMRDFKTWLGTFRPSIANYKYYTDFHNVFQNVDELKIPLNILNSLIGSQNIEQDFRNLITKYPETLKCIPILIAKRELDIYVLENSGVLLKYDFSNRNYSLEQYSAFMKETGLFDLLQHHIINNLVDYVTGVEVGLDSNGRKNRGGHLMENLVEKHLIKAGLVKEVNYFKEMTVKKIQKKWGIDLSAISNKGKTVKRFDFVIEGKDKVICIETNFYTGQGSKLNETARSYEEIAKSSKSVEGFQFVWITDGSEGWSKARHNLEETFDVLQDLYNIKDLENGIITKLIS